MSEITVAKSAGFCYGVKRAIELSRKAAAEHGSVYTLGPLIHNNDAIADLKRQGVVPVDEPEQARGCIVIRSHGVGKAVYDRISELGLECVDATCPFV
ncbi:MAG: bifunctional 4-hydroxy-3-methylbut-2-enyl diphosphate reductase/30S ribosomal protein S1, partial [Oscillospiraceae bacterium]|nr:bifunctional 4-hydroxy-3-methylbut-2-enyl diphosphate reductase/30S ribosomal protein S1 [Oscillospiraceae bacterium]